MKLILSLFLLVALTVAKAQNFNFENWTGSNPDPVGWYTSNPPNSPYIFVTKSSDNCNGSFSARSEIVASQQSGTYVCVPLLSGIGSVSMTNSYIPISVKPNELHGCYKFYRPINSSAIFSVTVKFKKNGTLIGSGTYSNSTNFATFQTFVSNISYSSSLTPDSVSIKFDFGLSGPLSSFEAGTYFIIDSLSFQNINGISVLNRNKNILIYPNPCHDIISIEGISTDDKYNYLVTDLAGKIILSDELKGEKKISLTGLEDGLYILQLINPNGPAISRIISFQE